MSENHIKGAEAGKALGDALADNTVLKELDLAEFYGTGIHFVKAFTPGLSDNGTILKITFSGDRRDSKPVTMESSMVEADFGGKGLGISGAIMVAAFLPKCT
jgi:hypothetical protein